MYSLDLHILAKQLYIVMGIPINNFGGAMGIRGTYDIAQGFKQILNNAFMS